MCVGCGSISLVKDRRRRSFESWLTKKGRQEYKVSGSRKSPAKEYLERVKSCHDTDCNESMMKKGFTALKNGTWEEYKETLSLRVGLRQDRRGVRVGEAEKMSIVQGIMLRSTDYLRRVIASVGGQGGATMTYLCPNCKSFLLEDYVCWVSGAKTYEVVVRNLWVKVRLEATEQAFGRANWGKF